MIERNLTQRHDHTHVFQEAQFTKDKRLTGGKFVRGWLVSRRGATDSCADITAGEGKTVIDVRGTCLIRETESMQCFV